jgi:hypothetical protein
VTPPTRRTHLLAAIVMVAALPITLRPQTPGPDLAPPVFHHLHLNAVNPAATIAGYMKLWPMTQQTTVGGFDALDNGSVFLLFNTVTAPAREQPQSAYWHQVWLTPNVREYVTRAKAAGYTVEPLYTSDEGGSVEALVSTIGQAVDHLAFTVTDLDAWVAKLQRENVKVLRRPYAFGTTRAALIEGPSREAIELIER